MQVKPLQFKLLRLAPTIFSRQMFVLRLFDSIVAEMKYFLGQSCSRSYFCWSDIKNYRHELVSETDIRKLFIKPLHSYRYLYTQVSE